MDENESSVSCLNNSSICVESVSLVENLRTFSDSLSLRNVLDPGAIQTQKSTNIEWLQ